MPDALTEATLPEDDDAAAELLADALVEAARRQGGHLLLAARQMAGIFPVPRRGEGLSERTVAAGMGISRRKLRETEASALRALRKRGAHLNPNPSPNKNKP